MFKAGWLGKSQKRPAHKLLVSEIANHGDVGRPSDGSGRCLQGRLEKASTCLGKGIGTVCLLSMALVVEIAFWHIMCFSNDGKGPWTKWLGGRPG